MSDVKDMPMGLGFRMAMNEKALNTYAEMTLEEKEREEFTRLKVIKRMQTSK